MYADSPRWLRTLERYLGWLAIPNLAVILVTLQALGFLMVLADPIWIMRLALVPGAVLHGEVWRLVTFLALPVSTSLLWVIFALWFLYFIVNVIESEWGAFKTTLYVLVSVLLTIGVAFALDLAVTEVTDLETSLFLAGAALFPELEIQLYLVLPVKMKWLGWLTMAFVGYRFFMAGWDGRIYLLAIYSNYLLFFGPALLGRVRNRIRRESFKRRMRG